MPIHRARHAVLPLAHRRRLTKRVIEAGRALNVAVHDHMGIGRAGVASFKTLGLM